MEPTKVYRDAHEDLANDPISCQFNLRNNLCKMCSYYCCLDLGLQNGHFPPDFLTKTLFTLLRYLSIPATLITHLILFKTAQN